MKPPISLIGAAAAVVAIAPAHATLVTHTILSAEADGEVRQSSTGAFTAATGSPATHLRVGFQSSFGSDGQAAGGLNAVWFFPLPKLDRAAGDSVQSALFVTTLLDESATSPITPRFNADLYALGWVSDPPALDGAAMFHAGADQSGAMGLGTGQVIQKIDNNLFTVFLDWEAVNAISVRKPVPVQADLEGQAALAAYIQAIYENPEFPNTGNEHLVLRLNPDRAASDTYQENGSTQFYGKGTTRYRVASSESASLGSTATVDYSEVVSTRLILAVEQSTATPAGAFRIRSVEAAANAQITLTFDSEAGKTYAVKHSTALTGFVTTAGGGVTAGAGSETSVTFANPLPGAPEVFFLVERQP